MFTIIFKFNDGTTTGHACASKTVRRAVFEDVMHHVGDHVAAWRGQDSAGAWDAGSVGAHEQITLAPIEMRVEWK